MNSHSGEIAASEGVRTLVRAVVDRIDQLTDRLVKQIYAEEVVYSDGVVERDDLWQSFSDNMTEILQSLAGLTPEGKDPYDAPRATGVRRADQRMPVESVLHTYRLGTEVMWEALLTEARGRSAEIRDELIDNAARLFQLADRFALAMVEAYREREGQLRRLDTERREAILDSLLTGHGAEPSVQVQAASVLNMPAHARYAVVVAKRDLARFDGKCRPHELMSGLGIHSVWRSRGDRTVGLLRLGATSLQRTRTGLGQLSASAAMSGEVASLAELGIAHQLAELTYQTLLPDSSEVAVLDDRLPEALLVSSPQLAIRLARGTLGRVLDLEPAERTMLLHTLETWFRCERSSARAAEQLYCHRNTVLNRLSRVEALTGGSLESDRHLLLCRLALLAAQLVPDASPAPDRS